MLGRGVCTEGCWTGQLLGGGVLGSGVLCPLHPEPRASLETTILS